MKIKIKLKKFLTIRYADPITALDLTDTYLCFGTMLGLSQYYTIETNKVTKLSETQDEFISGIIIKNNSLYLCIGDAKINKYDLTTKPLIYFSTNITSKEGTKNLSYSIQSSENIFFGESKPSLTSLESKNEMANYNNVLKNNGVDPNKLEEKKLLIPISKKNDEKFKLLKIQKLKKKFPPFQSAKRFEEEEKKNFKKYLEEEEKYSILKKKKIIYSTKKELFVFVSLFNDKGEEKKFPFFKDNDIGISHYWQAKIIDSQIDEDYETDEEQKNVAKYYCIKELKEAFQVIFNKGNKIVQNTKFLELCLFFYLLFLM